MVAAPIRLSAMIYSTGAWAATKNRSFPFARRSLPGCFMIARRFLLLCCFAWIVGGQAFVKLVTERPAFAFARREYDSWAGKFRDSLPNFGCVSWRSQRSCAAQQVKTHATSSRRGGLLWHGCWILSVDYCCRFLSRQWPGKGGTPVWNLIARRGCSPCCSRWWRVWRTWAGTTRPWLEGCALLGCYSRRPAKYLFFWAAPTTQFIFPFQLILLI